MKRGTRSSCRVSPKSGTTKKFFDQIKRIAPSIDKLKCNNGVSGWIFSNDKDLKSFETLDKDYCEAKIAESSKSFSYLKQICNDKSFFMNYLSTVNESGISFLRDNLIHQMVSILRI